MTQCTPTLFDFQDLGTRQVVAAFDGGKVSSDGGGLLLREVEARFGFLRQFANCFTDHRDPDLVEHPLVDLLKQRVFGLCLGYEDLNDHDQLRHDPLLSVLVGKKDPLGESRLRARDRGKALAGKSTLNRLELTPVRASGKGRYKKIVAHLDAMQRFLVEAFVQQYLLPPTRIVLDVDATNTPLPGHQLGRFFHGYYDEYCYLPLYIFCADHPLLALLRPSNIDPSTGLLKHLERIVARLRQQWPGESIVLRGDSGFCREHVMRWCETNGVDYLFGLAKNRRLLRILGGEMHQAQQQFLQTGQAARVFKDFSDRTLKSWSRERRVVGKAEHLAQGANPRFVVTTLSAVAWVAPTLYEQEYCARQRRESHQGAKTVRVRLPGQLRDHAGQSGAPVLGDRGLPRDAGPAAIRSGPDRDGHGPVRHDPAEAAQDRRGGQNQCPAGVSGVVGGLPVSGAVPTGLGKPACRQRAVARSSQPGTASRRSLTAQSDVASANSATPWRPPSVGTGSLQLETSVPN